MTPVRERMLEDMRDAKPSPLRKHGALRTDDLRAHSGMDQRLTGPQRCIPPVPQSASLRRTDAVLSRPVVPPPSNGRRVPP